MTWFGYMLVILWGSGALITVSQIGKPREPYTQRFAIIQIIMASFLIWGVLAVGTGSL